MFNRSIISYLRQWKVSEDRKPLVLRGARQVGKTTAMELFSREFDQFIHLNLDKPEDATLFSRQLPVRDLFQAILLDRNLPRVDGRILLFLDEVQNSPDAVRQLRYFYEDLPFIHVAAAGSLLEVALTQKKIGMPVGRVEHLFMYPLSFLEFLEATGEFQALSAIQKVPLSPLVLPKLFELFHRYVQIGGMPEVVARYALTKDVVVLRPVYQSLTTSFLDDIPKYSRNDTLKHVIRHCLEAAPYEAGDRIKFAGFGKSNYRSREAGEALKTLEQAMLVHLLYPTTSTELPLVPDRRKSPRLLFLDIGLINFAAGLQGRFFKHSELHSFYRGRIAEMIVGQEIIASDAAVSVNPVFWVREKRQAPAELDFLVQQDGSVFPVEVKAGAAGKLRSLHQFINRCSHSYAVRLYAGSLEINRLKTPEGKPFYLLNLPYFLAGQLKDYLLWFRSEVKMHDSLL